MMTSQSGCYTEHVQVTDDVRGLKLVSPQIEVIVLPHKGADIYTVIDRRTGIDVLLKTRQGVRPANHGRYSPDSATAWLEQYEGGWQEIFPNGGDANGYNGVELSFHGEASLLPYTYEVIQESPTTVIVDFHVRLFRSPLQLTRRMTLAGNVLTLNETLSSYVQIPIDLMWGHHPAFGAPFISPDTQIHTNAARLIADLVHDAPENLLVPGSEHDFPHVTTKTGVQNDFSRMPAAGEKRSSLAYLTDFDGPPWFALVNAPLDLGLGMVWSQDVFRTCWVWQEMNASQTFPFYGSVYTLAVEPWTSYPGHGLKTVMETTQTHRTLAPHETLRAELSLVLFQPSHMALLDAITLASRGALNDSKE